MFSPAVTLLLATLLPAVAEAGGHGFTVWETPPQPLLPSQDRFYNEEPAHLAGYSPGELIRVRTAPGNLTSIFNSSAAYHLVFRTVDSLGAPAWAFTTLLAPKAPYRRADPVDAKPRPTKGGTALLSYQVPYNTADVDASISARLYDPALALPGDVPSALARGWFVSIPDFESPRAAFLAGKLEGHATLDGVRAVLDLAEADDGPRHLDLLPLGLDAKRAKFALWGYSGGSLASIWAAELVSPACFPKLLRGGLRSHEVYPQPGMSVVI